LQQPCFPALTAGIVRAIGTIYFLAITFIVRVGTDGASAAAVAARHDVVILLHWRKPYLFFVAKSNKRKKRNHQKEKSNTNEGNRQLNEITKKRNRTKSPKTRNHQLNEINKKRNRTKSPKTRNRPKHAKRTKTMKSNQTQEPRNKTTTTKKTKHEISLCVIHRIAQQRTALDGMDRLEPILLRLHRLLIDGLHAFEPTVRFHLPRRRLPAIGTQHRHKY
jgi:hypothetical protein